MRYLGHVAELLEQKKLPVLKALLERETVVRCLKHILARRLRECENAELYAPMLSWILNCLLAPTEFLAKINDGSVNMTGRPVTQDTKEIEKPQAEDK